MNRFLPVIVFCISAFFWSCDTTADQPPVVIERLESAIFAAKSPTELTNVFTKNAFLQQYFVNNQNAGIIDTALVSQLYANASNKDLRAFNDELQQYFGDLSEVEAQLGEAFKNIKKNYPDFKPPRIATTVSGFLGPDFYFSDTLIVIGLDYFGGSNAKYRPQNLYDYQLTHYDKPNIVPTIVFYLSQQFNKTNTQDQTLLADMVWFGKGYAFVKEALPDLPDNLIVNYSEEQLSDVNASEQGIWGYFLERKLLYQTREAEKARFIDERPATVEINQDCPGAIARWLGWRIVQLYRRENSNIPLKTLMSNTDSQKILADSHYKGESPD